MGWLFKNGSTRRGLIAQRIEGWERQSDEILVKRVCLAHCYRGGVFAGVLWSVWERTFSQDCQECQPTERRIQCDLLRFQDGAWGYKDLEESMHPYFYSCPQKYLNLVPLDRFGGNAEWRELVQQHHQRQAERRKLRAAAM